MSSPIVIVPAQDVAIVVLSRPQMANALDPEGAEALRSALRGATQDPDVRAIVITGAGRAFSAGGDLKWVARHPEGIAEGFRVLTEFWHGVVLTIRQSPKPVVAAINGVAAGGGFSLAMACDFRVMAEGAILRQGYSSAGLSMDAGGTHHLTRLAGLARALEITTFDEPIDWARALAWGLVTQVASADALMPDATALARRAASGSRQSFSEMKQLLNASFENDLATQLDLERAAIIRCGGLADGIEGVRTFAERRSPNFRGDV